MLLYIIYNINVAVLVRGRANTRLLHIIYSINVSVLVRGGANIMLLYIIYSINVLASGFLSCCLNGPLPCV